MMSIKLPANAACNDRIEVMTPDGRTVEIIVPPNCVGGQTINVVVDDDITASAPPAPREYTSNEPHNVSVTPTDPQSNRAILGAAAAAAVVGVILIGPVTGVVVAGAAIYATTRNDQIGDAARKGGAAACSAFDFGMAKAREHNVFDRLKDAGAATYKKALEVDNEFKITEQAHKAATDLNNEHKITERVTAATVDAAVRTPGALSSMFKYAAAASAAAKK